MSRHVRRRGRSQPLAAARRRTRLRRVVALGGMLGAVGGLVTLRSALAPSPSQALGAAGMASAVGGQKATPGPVHHTSSAPHPAQHHAQHHVQHTATAAPRPARRQVTGNAFDVGYGVVQVRVSLVGKHISDVTALSLPQGGRSSDISSYAAPQLRREALSAQSANIDTVSGASYTSAGYARSLQSALDKSGA